MTLFKYITLSISILILSACTQLQKPLPPIKAGDYNSFVTYAQSYIKREMKKYDIKGLSIAIVDGDRLIWSQGFGYADVTKKVKATAHTTYRVASLSKILNAVAILKLQEESKLNINQPISRYLPHFRMKSPRKLTQKITLKNILTHHSGIAPLPPFSGMENPAMGSCENLLGLLKKNYLSISPNTLMSYSNQAIALSGCVVEKVTHQKYTQFMQKKILTPFGMNHSRYETQITTPKHAKCYKNGTEAKDNAYYFMPAIGLSSNVLDMSRFLRMMILGGKLNGKQFLSKHSIAYMLRQHNKHIMLDWDTPMALGWFIEDHYAEKFYYHTGRASNYLSVMAFSRKSQLGMVLLSNSESSELYLAELAKHLLSSAWQAKHDHKIHKNTKNIMLPKLQNNFEGTYAITSLSSSLAKIQKLTENLYSIKTTYGELYLKKTSHSCYTINDPHHIKKKGLVNFKSPKGILKHDYTEQKQVLKRYAHFRA